MDKDLWEQIKRSLMAKNPGNKPLLTWFDPVKLVGTEQSDNNIRCLRLGVPSTLHQYWITQNMLDRIFQEVSDVYKHPVRIEFVVNQDAASAIPENPLSLEIPQMPEIANIQRNDPIKSEGLNPDFTFNTFVVGRNNEFAHAACFSVAERPGKGYNPLFICGPSGMGKTHLLNAVGNYIRDIQPGLRITYLSAERFLNECISHIKNNKMDQFRLRYRERCDVLLIDDIHVLGHKEFAQEEFFHTLNELFERKKQVVVASDRMPKDIKGIEDRIRTRLEWGLIADIQMPDLETRVAILRYKSELQKIPLSEDVVNYVARISKKSIRELEGNLNKIKIFSDLKGTVINLDVAKQVLANHSSESQTITIEEIQKMCADHFSVKLTDLKSETRVKPIVMARQTAMFLIKKFLDTSLTDIGRAFGGKDHSTIIHALKKIADQRIKNQELDREISILENRIHNVIEQ